MAQQHFPKAHTVVGKSPNLKKMYNAVQTALALASASKNGAVRIGLQKKQKYTNIHANKKRDQIYTKTKGRKIELLQIH